VKWGVGPATERTFFSFSLSMTVSQAVFNLFNRNATQKTQTLSLSTYIFLRRYLSVNNNTFHEPSLLLQFFFLHHHQSYSYLCLFPFITSLISHELVPSHNSSHSFSSTVYFISFPHLIFINYYFGWLILYWLVVGFDRFMKKVTVFF